MSYKNTKKKSFNQFSVKLTIIFFTFLSYSNFAISNDSSILLLEYFGDSASSIYGLTKSSLQSKATGGYYQDLAKRINTKLDDGRHSSKLVKSQFDLISNALTHAAITKPNKLGTPALLFISYGSKKMGEDISTQIYEKSKKDAAKILYASLTEQGITADSLSKMSPEQLLKIKQDLKNGDDVLKEKFGNNEDALKLYQAHKEDILRESAFASLISAAESRETLDELGAKFVETKKNIDDYHKETTEHLKYISSELKEIKKTTEQMQSDISNISNNLSSLTLVSSMSWTAEQKVAAINSGLFPDMSAEEKAANLKLLSNEIKLQERISNLNKTTQNLNQAATIMSNLGVDEKLVKAVQKGEIVSSAFTSYITGDYMSAVASISGLAGFGKPDMEQQRHAALMSYLGDEFRKINQQLEEIKQIQKATLEQLQILDTKVDDISERTKVIEKNVFLARSALQYIIQREFQSCGAVVGDSDNQFVYLNSHILNSFFEHVDSAKNISECYKTYYDKFNAEIYNYKWSGGLLSEAQFPETKITDDTVLISMIGQESDKKLKAYKATRDFLLAYFKDKKRFNSSNPAKHLVNLTELSLNTNETKLKRDAIINIQNELEAFNCNQNGDNKELINDTLREMICTSKTNLERPLSTLINDTLLGPQVFRLIDMGIPIAKLSDFVYTDPNNLNATRRVTLDELRNIETNGISEGIHIAANEKKSKRTFEKLNWLAHAYLIQQSVMYGDYTINAIVDVLYKPEKNTLSLTENPQEELHTLALEALRNNDILARNVVMVALRKSIINNAVEGDAKQTPQVTYYSFAIKNYIGEASCNNDNITNVDLQKLLPNWRFEWIPTENEVKNDSNLSKCVDKSNSTGPFGLLVIGDKLKIKAPSPAQVKTGEYEIAPTLGLALSYRDKTIEQLQLRDIAYLLNDEHGLSRNSFAESLLKSECLSGACKF